MVHERRHSAQRRGARSGAPKKFANLRICGGPRASQSTAKLPSCARCFKLCRTVRDHAHCSARTKSPKECATNGCGVVNDEQRCARRNCIQRDLARCRIKRHRRHDDVGAAERIVNR